MVSYTSVLSIKYGLSDFLLPSCCHADRDIIIKSIWFFNSFKKIQRKVPHFCDTFRNLLNLITAINGVVTEGYHLLPRRRFFLFIIFDKVERDDAFVGVDPAQSTL